MGAVGLTSLTCLTCLTVFNILGASVIQVTKGRDWFVAKSILVEDPTEDDAIKT